MVNIRRSQIQTGRLIHSFSKEPINIGQVQAHPHLLQYACHHLVDAINSIQSPTCLPHTTLPFFNTSPCLLVGTTYSNVSTPPLGAITAIARWSGENDYICQINPTLVPPMPSTTRRSGPHHPPGQVLVVGSDSIFFDFSLLIWWLTSSGQRSGGLFLAHSHIHLVALFYKGCTFPFHIHTYDLACCIYIFFDS